MSVVPGATAVATPLASIVATAVLLEAQVAVVVRSSVPPADPNVPVSVYCRVVGAELLPRGMAVLFGEIARFVALAAVTVKFEVAPGVPAAMAVIVVVPALIALATPPTEMVATAVFEELQVTREVPSLMLPSL
jgi:hypothetical protein